MMRVVIFCGGSGKRFWPLSREQKPKQLDKNIFNGKSTFQMQVERALSVADANDIFIATVKQLATEVKKQAPQIPENNVIIEPARRDLAPAVGLVNTLLKTFDKDEPYAILWSDHVVKQPGIFSQMLGSAAGIIQNDPNQIVFIGQKPRYAEENLGYIGLDERKQNHQHLTSNVKCYAFKDWYYRPSRERAEELITSGKYVWNTGYFVTTPHYLAQKYAEYAPNMYVALQEIVQHYGANQWEPELNRIYPDLEKVSFDDKIVTHIPPEEASVLVADFGWYDPGSLYALKKFLEDNPEANVIKGHGEQLYSEDSLIFNRSGDKLVVGLGLKGHIVVNTDDVVLVVEKSHIPKIKELLRGFEGSSLERYL